MQAESEVPQVLLVLGVAGLVVPVVRELSVTVVQVVTVELAGVQHQPRLTVVLAVLAVLAVQLQQAGQATVETAVLVELDTTELTQRRA